MKVVKRAYFDQDGNLLIKPYRIRDLAAIYNICTKTMKNWIAVSCPEIKRGKSQFYSVSQVITIVNAIGLPQTIIIKKAA
jgi:hypothetical protein